MRRSPDEATDRGVSPVVGGILVVGITVVLAAAGGMLFMGIGSDSLPDSPATMAKVDLTPDQTEVTLSIARTTGNTTLEIHVNGKKFDTWEQIQVGDAQRLNCLRPDDTIKVIESKSGSDKTYVTATHTVPSNVDPPSNCPRHAVYLSGHPAASTFVNLSGWGTSGGGDRTLTSSVPGGEPRRGDNVMKVTADPDNSWSGAYTEYSDQGAMDVEPGQVYTVSAWVYIPEGTDIGAEMRFHPRVQSSSTCCHAYTMLESDRVIERNMPHGSWQFVYYVYEIDESITDPVARLSVISGGSGGATGPVYVDAVKMAEGDRTVNDD